MNATSAMRSVARASPSVLRKHHAPFRISQFTTQTQRSLHIRTSPLLSSRRLLPPSRIGPQARYESTEVSPRPVTDRPSSIENSSTADDAEKAERKAQEPAYELSFTCRKCNHRSSHRITKQAYHHGTTLVTCPECKGRHLISDHLKIFSDKSVTLEDIMKEKGEFLKKGRLDENGDVEFYGDSKSG